MRDSVKVIGAVLVFVSLAVPAMANETGGKLLREDWYAAYLGGQKIGYTYQKAVSLPGPDGPRYRTTANQDFTISRFGQEVRLISDSVVLEDETGGLINFEYAQRQATSSQTTQGRVQGDELIVEAGAGANLREMRLPAPEGLCPWGLYQLQQQKGHKEGTSYTVPVFSPEFVGQSVMLTVEVGPKEVVEVFGATKTLRRRESTLSVLPGMRVTEWVDEDGKPILTRMPVVPGMNVEIRLTTREVATAPPGRVDVMSVATIPTDRAIERPREVQRLQLRLTPKDGQGEVPDVPTGPYQSAERTDDGLTVTVARPQGEPAAGYRLPYDGEEYAHLLRPNRWLETDDPLIGKMAREAVGEETDPAKAARLIEAYVTEHIEQKNLSLAMATAAETARQRTGDCTEHAMLAAALARAAGMPSRVMVGVVYVNVPEGSGLFAYHAWTEVYVGQWLPIDAALGGYDATHVAFGRTDLNSPGSLSDMTSFIPFVGRIDIEILDVQYGSGEQGAADASPLADTRTSDLQSLLAGGR
ncbi:MAG: transglutaminase domain-containing protein [Candidatus Brocadiia bacterium]